MILWLLAQAEWLEPGGRSDAWIRATAVSRERLARLNFNDALVKQYLPRLKDRCDLVRKMNGFDWKTITAVEILQDMLEDLSSGRVPMKRYAGQGLGFPFWSEAMRRIEAIWVQVPPNYDPERNYQLFLYYKCGGGIHNRNGKAAGGYRPTAQICRQVDDTFHAWSSFNTQVKGRMNCDLELTEAIPALAKDFSVDLDRLFLTGWSDGGFTALWLASRYPQLVAGIAPNCANWQYGNVEDVSLSGVPVLVVDGWGDSGYLEHNLARWQALSNMGYEIECLLGHHGHSYQPYEDEEEFGRILEWARTKRRNRNPKHVRYATWNLSWHRAWWVSIERRIEPALAARIDAEISGNRIDVRSENVEAYRLALNDKLVDPSAPLEVVTNGKPSYSGPFRAEIAIGQPPAGRFVKDALHPDDIAAVVVNSTYDVGGYLGLPRMPWLRIGGAPWSPTGARMDATEAELKENNLFLFGGPDQNRVTARIAADLPVKFGKDAFTIGEKVYDRPGQAVKFLHPNPLNPHRYVIVYAVNGATPPGDPKFLEESAWEFRSGDCIVYGRPAQAAKFGISFGGRDLGHVVFDSRWRAPDPTVLGTAEKTFDYLGIQRLKADAMREAAEVDAAVVFAFPDSWNRFQNSIPEGPVTLGDIAATHMFPEYAMLAEVSGRTLASIVDRAAAASVDAEIDPDRTYRIALDYKGACSGALSFQADRSKMPRLFHFHTSREYLKGPGTALPLANLRISNIQWAEAVARYFRKHKNVSPRGASRHLAEYLVNPETNVLPGQEWLHIALGHGTLALGVEGQNSKKFSESGGRFSLANVEVTVEKAELARSCGVWNVRMSNRSDRDATVTAVLGSEWVRNVYGGTWPEKSSFLRGFLQGSSAIAFVSGEARPIVLSNAGYNSGLVGLERTLLVPAGRSQTLALAFGPADTLQALKPEIDEALWKD